MDLEMRLNYFKEIRKKLEKHSLKENPIALWNMFYFKKPSYKYVLHEYSELMRQKDAETYREVIEYIDSLVKR